MVFEYEDHGVDPLISLLSVKNTCSSFIIIKW